MSTSSTSAAAPSVAGISQNEAPVCVTFPVDKECLRKFVIHDGGQDVTIYHLYPRLSDWLGRKLPDKVNPRSHDEEALKSSVARSIETTILESPEDFYLANRGATILAQCLRYDPEKGLVEVTVVDSSLEGIADGATTDAVLGKVQRDIAAGKATSESLPEGVTLESLSRGRIHLEVIVGLTSKDRIDAMVLGRNTSRQVKPWSMSDFRGSFDWIREILETPSSDLAGKVGYEENSGKSTTVLDALSLLTLFHREFDGKGKAPTVAYSSKGRMDARLNDVKLQPGYKGLSPILADILKLHDHIYASFESAYRQAKDGKAKLGRRAGIENKKHRLHLTEREVSYVIPSGLIFPLLASLRALVGYKASGEAYWKTSPTQFFDKYGAELVGALIEQLDMLGGNPQTAGKKKPVYTALHDRARLLLAEEMSA